MSPVTATALRAKVSFPNLDGLRFLAFVLVFLGHGFPELARTITQECGLAGKAIFGMAGVGVSFFFVLSGFLITYLILTEIHLNGRVNVTAFYVRRTLRIWPLYFVIILYAFLVGPSLAAYNHWIRSDGLDGILEPAAALVSGLFSYHGAGNPAYYATFMSNFEVMRLLSQDAGAMLTDVTWSVAIEEQFYLTWPLWFRLVKRPHYIHIFLFVLLSSTLFRAFNVHSREVLYFHTFSVIGDMAIGGLCAYCAIERAGFVSWLARLSRTTVVGVYAVGCTILVCENVVFVGSVLVVFKRIIFAVFFAFIVLEQNYCERSLFKMEHRRLISRLGVYTYGLYLLHPLGIMLVDRSVAIFAGEASGALVDLGKGVAALALTVLFAASTYHLIEKPLLELKKRFAAIAR